MNKSGKSKQGDLNDSYRNQKVDSSHTGKDG